MKISLFSVMLPELTPEEATPLIADAGYDGIEWRVTTIPPERRNEDPSFWGNNYCTLAPTDGDAQRARDLAGAAGLELPTLGTYINMGDLTAVETSMKFAQTAGAACIRVGVGKTGTAPFTELFEQTRAFLADCESLAQTYRIKAVVEIHHDTIAASASAALRLLDGRDPAQLGVIYDPGNMAKEGYEDYRNGINMLGAYLSHVHLKNVAFKRPDGGGLWESFWSPLEDGVINFPFLIRSLLDAGYDGWLGVEDFSAERPGREALTTNIQFVRNLLQNA